MKILRENIKTEFQYLGGFTAQEVLKSQHGRFQGLPLIYLVTNSAGVVVYVGQTSRSMRARLREHLGKWCFKLRLENTVHLFQSVLPIYQSDLERIETALIQVFGPEWNNRDKPRAGMKGKGRHLPAKELLFDLELASLAIRAVKPRFLEAEHSTAGYAYLVLRFDLATGKTELCPFCDQRHVHGIGSGGHRSPHCYKVIRESLIVQGVTVKQENGYILQPAKVVQ